MVVVTAFLMLASAGLTCRSIGQFGAKSGFKVCRLPLELLLMVEFSPLKSVMA